MEVTMFDPLENMDKDLVQVAVKQRIRNIIRSYNNATDVISEPIQNAMDAIVQAQHLGLSSAGSVNIRINAKTNEIQVIDDGPGISLALLRKFLAPDVTGKKELFAAGKVRGHKGVGLTFLAYGFNFFEIESRTPDGEHYVLRMEGGRSWVEGDAGARPQAMVSTVVASPVVEKHGTAVRIRVGPESQPREISKTFNNATLTAAILESQTAVGIVPPLDKSHPKVNVKLLHTDSGNATVEYPLRAHFRYPHQQIPASHHVIDIGAYKKDHSLAVEPEAKHKKKYHAAYRFYGPGEVKDFISQGGEVMTDADEVKKFIDTHLLNVYALFSYSTAYTHMLRDAWSVVGNKKFYQAGVRIATDGMISSWKRDVDLPHAGGNKDRLWIVYHFRGIEQDMGRKDFPQEIHDVVKLTEAKVSAELIKDSLPFLRPTPKAKAIDDNSEPVDPAVKAHERAKTPLSPGSIPGLGAIGFGSTPCSESDVIALFNQLIGMGLLKCFRPMYFSSVDDYDSYFEYDPKNVSEKLQASLPGDPTILKREAKGVAEFKFDGGSLLEDLLNETKQWTEMRFLVCWTVPLDAVKRGGDSLQFSPTLSSDDRKYAGVTHLATLQSHGNAPLYVLALRDVLEQCAK